MRIWHWSGRIAERWRTVTVSLLGSHVDVGEVLIRERLALQWMPGTAAHIERHVVFLIRANPLEKATRPV